MADIVITPADVLLVTGSAQIAVLSTGVTALAGQPIYRETAGTYALSDVSVAASQTLDGVALSNGNSGQTITMAPVGTSIDLGSGDTASAMVLCLGEDPGGIGEPANVASGNPVVVIGVVDNDGTNITISRVVGGDVA